MSNSFNNSLGAEKLLSSKLDLLMATNAGGSFCKHPSMELYFLGSILFFPHVQQHNDMRVYWDLLQHYNSVVALLTRAVFKQLYHNMLSTSVVLS